MTISIELKETLASVPTATLSNVLFKRGYGRFCVRGSMPLGGGYGRVVGPAFTLRFVPARPDLLSPASPKFVCIRAAIERIPEDAVVVIDAQGAEAGGTIGDIMALRMSMRKAAALVTDGMIRDAEGIRRVGLAVWSRGTIAAPAGVALAFAGSQETIACGGVAVQPGDIIVADGDGAMVIPADIAADVAAEAVAAEKLDGWITRQVENGIPLPGLYPPNAETLARYKSETGG